MMNPFFQQIILKTVKRRLKKENKHNDDKQISSEIEIHKIYITHIIRDTIFISIGIISAGFGLKGFLLPNSFIDGGVTGISLLTAEITGVSLSILIVVINLPFLILGFSQIGKQFALKSIIAIIGLALVVHFIPYPVITTDKLLVAVFWGFFLGAGIGLAIRGGAVLDGT